MGEAGLGGITGVINDTEPTLSLAIIRQEYVNDSREGQSACAHPKVVEGVSQYAHVTILVFSCLKSPSISKDQLQN